MENRYAERVKAVRAFLEENDYDAIIISGTDPHSSEYPAERWKQVEWVSGFTGEAGDIVITKEHAGLWTDTRYFIQAERQLAGTGIELHKTRVPDEVLIPEFLAGHFPSRGPVTVVFDGLCQSIGAIDELKDTLAKAYGSTSYNLVDIPDLISEFWQDRPPIPQTPVRVLPDHLVGESSSSKLKWLREKTASEACGSMLLSSLDEIAWMLNVRADDIAYNPYVISYLLVTSSRAFWFVRDVDNVPTVEGITNVAYGSLAEGLKDAAAEGALFVDPSTLSYNVYSTISSIFRQGETKFGKSPVILRKALKNSTEIEAQRKAYFEDGIAMERFLFWLEKEVKNGNDVTEWDASEHLSSLRAAISGYRGNSFENISAYGENAALPHYSTPKFGSAALKPKGIYLVDSGGHYDFGTTDITRTVPLGRCTRLEKEDYTLVLKGMIELSMARFPKGTAGCQIDAIARGPMWLGKRNFGHGTGHGIGFYSGVHEGPQSIRQNFLQQPLLPGMITSNEPGLYREGKHGIRHENVLLCVEDGKNEFGQWLAFETLTCCHIDTKAIVRRLLTKAERKWLNSYNKRVYRTLKDSLEPQVATWLKKKCKKI